ncbi:MAG: hypothetical protein HQ517_00045 [SAR324 cluster bacterium]|nr:hypothetical protein [SAR324 cluster bacterium]
MENLLQYFIPVILLAALVVGWGLTQILAKKMKINNNIDQGGCCGACEKRRHCSKSEGEDLTPTSVE